MGKKNNKAQERVGLDFTMAKPFLEGLLSHMQGGVFTIDKEKRITSFSKSAMWITGFCMDEVKGRNCKDILNCIMCETCCPFEGIMKRGSSTFRTDVEIHGKDGKPIPVNITSFALINKGEIVGMCEIFRDISELQSLQNQLMRTDRFAVLGQLAAGVAHEVNNPLNGILTYIKLILKKMKEENFLTPEFDKYLSTMERETINIGRIVRNLLDFSRRTEPEIIPLHISEVIDQSLLLISDQLKIRNIEVIKEDKYNLPEIRGDFGQLQQVFLNLMLNSIQAMPDGGKLIINTTAEGAPGKECFVFVSVSDTGCGIPQKNLHKIFDPLFTTKGGKETVGLGLGLSIVERILKAHHAHITVKSKVGEGTIFNIRFSTK